MYKDKILITGGSGFIGINLVRHFYNLGFEVINYDVNKPIDKIHLDKWIQGDILDFKKIEKVILDFQPDYILHFAARTDLNENKDIIKYNSNIDGVKNLVNIINNCNFIKRVIYASSRMVCKIDYIPKDYSDYCPPNLYGKSKMIGEQIVKENAKHDYLIIRPTSIWGPFFHVPYRTFFDSIQKGTFFLPKNHNPKKSFGFVYNTVFQIEKLLLTEKINLGKTYYLTDYPPIELKLWSNLISGKLKNKSIREISPNVLRLVALIGDIFSFLGWKSVPLTTFRYNNLITNMVYNTDELEKICGELPYSLEEGVEITLNWIEDAKKIKSE